MTSLYFIFAGETSGDLHGSRLMQAMKGAAFCGVGGPQMRKEGFDCLIEMESFQVMGFSDVIQSLPHLLKQFYRVRDHILESKPDCAILIDYPGFNLRLARSLRKKGFKGKIVQYICPTIWAHGKGRIKILADHYDLLLTIYPFEASYFSDTSLKVNYIGNPLAETIRAHSYQTDWKDQTEIPKDREIIALFPGSRKNEIEVHTLQQLQAAAKLKQKYPHFHFALSCAQECLNDRLLQIIQTGPLKLNEDLHMIPPHFHYELMKGCKAALAKSGTVTLELALHAVPTVVHYQLSTLNYLFAKFILRLKLSHYCIVNILGSRTIFPEFIGRKISPADLDDQVEQISTNQTRRTEMIEAGQMVKEQLGNQSSHELAAKAIKEMMAC